MSHTRIEKDSMGELDVPLDALYGAQTQRAVNNFPVSGQSMPEAFIRALLLIKASAAKANAELDTLDAEIAEAIVNAADKLQKDPALCHHFPVDVFQTGSGTSTNMNANEVLATLASKSCGQSVSPNDHVNCGQSSNDVIPTAIHVSASLLVAQNLLPAMEHLAQSCRDKAQSVDQYVKTGRTHLMDAMPVRLSQPINAWAGLIEQHIGNIKALQAQLQSLAQGGTAVGTGVNAHEQFAATFCNKLNALTGLTFTPAADFFTHISSQDTAVALSGQLKASAVSLIKIANDLRWMNSGPLAGLSEIELEALQPGSSIMPGKVNPVIPEAAVMAGYQVIGNDTAITLGGQSGNFELNVSLPLVAHNLIQSITLISNASRLLADKAIKTFKVNEQSLQASVARNPILVTALNPIVGYLKAAEIAKAAYASGRPVIDVAAEMTDISEDELKQLLDPRKLTQ
ncbi:lyase family protein [Gilvimarinus sp. DA14]|uniref:class II fumarate hydratase n=1 Tax=Gilvimarinus sp. DA14 TaxID=2956798 RepID=UPI0020B72597|nr:class II fumarate hydratase [Gilvimarinus sp. DA14]UTF60611.1 class II fumarate hydratase [Gilvimarinus sp. DA14]